MKRLFGISSLIFFMSTFFATPKIEQAVVWLSYARQDFMAAELLAEKKDSFLFGITLYHIEQSVEKALKAFLINHAKKFALTHDINILLKECCLINPDLNKFKEIVSEINPYSTKGRYPNNAYKEPEISYIYELLQKADDLMHVLIQDIV
jgi:HEPN domain-containing protein